jgi:hypothetical protein
MNLPTPSIQYSEKDQAQTRNILELEDRNNHKRNRDVEIGASRLILTSPNGTRYRITVSNAGTLSATSI